MKTIRVRTLIRAATLALGLGVGINAPETAKAEDPLIVGTHVWPGFMPSWIIREKNLFDVTGANAEVRDFRRVVDSLSAFTAGKIQCNAMIVADVQIPLSQGVPIKVVWLTDESSGADGIVARHEVETIADFKGRRVAYEFGGVSQLLLLKALESVGLTMDDIHSVNMSSYDAGTAFVGGSVDVAVTWEPFLSQGVESGHGRVIFDSSMTPGLIPDLYACRQEAIDNRPEDILHIVEAWKLALDYIETNPDDAMRIMGLQAGITGEEVLEQRAGIKPYTVEEVCDQLADKNSGFYKNALIQGEFLVDNDFIDKVPDIPTLADHRFACGAVGKYDTSELLKQ
jgi:NitT/TauT family transport system substrate-binding protein